MRHFQKVADNVDVLPLVIALYRQSGLWDRRTARTDGDSPHKAVSDIWVRFRDDQQLTSAESYAEMFVPVMYPAWHVLPQIRPLAFGLMTRLEAVQLGIVLITRVPPKCQVEPHHDRGRWAAEFFNVKVAIPLATNPDCYNTCEDERVTMRVGDVWLFENQCIHSTVNDGETDRITLLLSMRCE